MNHQPVDKAKVDLWMAANLAVNTARAYYSQPFEGDFKLEKTHTLLADIAYLNGYIKEIQASLDVTFAGTGDTKIVFLAALVEAQPWIDARGEYLTWFVKEWPKTSLAEAFGQSYTKLSGTSPQWDSALVPDSASLKTLNEQQEYIREVLKDVTARAREQVPMPRFGAARKQSANTARYRWAIDAIEAHSGLKAVQSEMSALLENAHWRIEGDLVKSNASRIIKAVAAKVKLISLEMNVVVATQIWADFLEDGTGQRMAVAMGLDMSDAFAWGASVSETAAGAGLSPTPERAASTSTDLYLF